MRAFDHAMTIFELTKAFPKDERYALTDQIRRSSRAVAANIAEAWQKRRYEAAFILRLTDSMAEAAETQDWLSFGHKCGYLSQEQWSELFRAYDGILKTLDAMILYSAKWCRKSSGSANTPQSTTYTEPSNPE